jgi:hypothetical protein
LLKVGAIYPYSYLWSREKASGEESGRKSRPVCLLIRMESTGLLFLFPITSQKPDDDEPFTDRIPDVECRRSGLRDPAWIVMSEANITPETILYDFISLTPTGEFSRAYREKILAIAKAAIAARRMKTVKR